MALGAVAVPGHHPHVPQLDLLRAARPDQQAGRAALVAAGPEGGGRRLVPAGPEGARLVGPDHAGARHLRGLDQAGDGDPEGRGQPADGGHARGRPRLLHLGEHALAHPRPGRQVLQRPGQPGPMTPHVATYGRVDVLLLRHRPAPVRTNKLFGRFTILHYTTLHRTFNVLVSRWWDQYEKR